MNQVALAPQIDGLTFVRILGSGGFAHVFLYDQANPQRKVAVKVLRETGLSSSTVRSFTAEANAMARLEHPYIVPVYATGTARDQRPYIVMMYYPKPSLAERARAERFSVAETLRLGIQLGSAVETAHRAGLLHRDIKPANILTNAYDKPGLTDFGIAGQMTDAEDHDLGVSVPWSPPEVLYATAPGSIRSDVYSLAATLWHLLVGRSPFDVPGGDNTPFAMMRRIRDLPAPSTGRTDVPASLDRLLRAAMEKDPALRPRSAWEFIGALQAIEQELRLPRTPLELATEESVGATKSRLAPSGDRTQVRAPQVVSPSSTFPSLPVAAPSTSSPEVPPDRRDIEDLATRRSIPKATPITGYSDGVEGETLVRGVSGTVPSAGIVDDRQPRHGAIAVLGVLLVVAIAGIGWYLVGTQQPARPSASVTVSEQPPEVGAAGLPPGQPTVVGTRSSGEVIFTWTYPNPAPDDQFEWRVSGTSAVNKTDKPTATVPAPDEGKVCIGVKIYRYDGSNGPSDWTEGCEP